MCGAEIVAERSVPIPAALLLLTQESCYGGAIWGHMGPYGIRAWHTTQMKSQSINRDYNRAKTRKVRFEGIALMPNRHHPEKQVSAAVEFVLRCFVDPQTFNCCARRTAVAVAVAGVV